MKTLVYSLVLAAALAAQTPTAPITPSTVVARVGDHDVTAEELGKVIRNWNSEQFRQYQADPRAALQQIYTFKYLASKAEAMKLGDEDPWKGQIEYAREGILGTAMASYERNNFKVSEPDMEAFYAANKSRYEQAKIKVIMLGFQERILAGTSQDDVKKAAETVVRNQQVKAKRSEQDALALAADIVKQLRAGADFVAMVKKYSDDDSKTADGDYGTITASGSFPEEMKKAVFALNPGEVSDPVRQPNALYIIRVMDRAPLPIEKVRESIIGEIKDNHLKTFGTDLGKKFTPTIVRPEFFLAPPPPAQAPKP
jgi:parvulin-like peptidyl-prolyl isomerase